MVQDRENASQSDKALALVGWILDRSIEGIPPLSSAKALAAEYRRDRSYHTSEERIKALVRWEATKNFASGFVTGLGGIATLPVAVPAALGASWVLQGRLAGAIATLHGHRLSEDRVRTLILLAIIGDSGKEAVKKAGQIVGKKLTMNAVKRLPGRALIEINKQVGFRLLTKAGQKGVLNLAKAVPVAGGVVGGFVDAAGCVAVGKIADRLFRPPASPKPSRPQAPGRERKAARPTGGDLRHQGRTGTARTRRAAASVAH